MRRNLKASRARQSVSPTVLTDRALASIAAGDDGVIHAQVLGGGDLRALGISGSGK